MTNTETWCVYKHTAPNGKIYIGITHRDPVRRWGNGGQGYKNNKHFWSAIQKYGWDNFSHEILIDGLTYPEACAKEIVLIKETNSYNSRFGYNIALGGQGHTMTEEMKAKQRDRLKEAYSAEERREMTRQRSKKMWADENWRQLHTGEHHPMFGHRHSKESRQKMSESRKQLIASLKERGLPTPGTGRVLSEETKEKIAKARKGTHWNYTLTEKQREARSIAKLGERNPNFQKPMNPELSTKLTEINSRPVFQIMDNGKSTRYISIAEAEKVTGICATNISRVCRNQRKTAGGFRWEYAPRDAGQRST